MEITYDNIEDFLWEDSAIYVYRGILKISRIYTPYSLIDNTEEVRRRISKRFWNQVQLDPDESAKIKFFFNNDYISEAVYHLFPENTELKCELGFGWDYYTIEKNLNSFRCTDDDIKFIAIDHYAQDRTFVLRYYGGSLEELVGLELFQAGFEFDGAHGLEYGCIAYFHKKSVGTIVASNSTLLAQLKDRLQEKLCAE